MDVLMVADTLRSPELRHEVPVAIVDPVIYVERGGARHLFANAFELSRLAHLGGLEARSLEELGLEEVLAEGASYHDAVRKELALRACRELGLVEAVAPRDFPLEAAQYLETKGVRVRADGALFDARRRVKTKAELDGIRRAQRATEKAMEAIRARLRRGGEVTSEELHAAAARAFTDSGVVFDSAIVSHGPQAASVHDPGSGPIAPGEPIICDLYPRDPESGCFADMTRTFCLGEPPAELVDYQRLCREALERVEAAIRPGARGSDLFALACEVFEERGFPTLRTKEPRELLESGFIHGLGHGVGLEVHEAPLLWLGDEELVAGDVVTVEPGLYRKGFGGCRLEDLVLVTDEGCEVLTDFPYELEP